MIYEEATKGNYKWIFMDIVADIVKIYSFLLRYPYTLVTLSFLSIATYYDIKDREIDTKLYIAVIPSCVLIYIFMYSTNLLSLFDIIATSVATAIVALATYLLARQDMIGYGDVFLVTVVGALNPRLVNIWGIYTTPLVLSLIFGLVYLFSLIVSNLIHNLRRRDMFREIARDFSKWETVFYLLIGKVMTVDEFKKSRFYFPLVTNSTKRRTAKVGVEPLSGSDYEVEGDYVIATYGFPFAAVLFMGYIITVSLMFYGFLNETAHGCMR